MGNAYGLYKHPEITPSPFCESAFDPLLGFRKGRKKRVMLAKQEEMESSKIPIEDRDYCAHHLLDYRACRADTYPFVYRCHHEKHVYLHCEYEDYVLRLKEYERDKRLRLKYKEDIKEQMCKSN